MEIINLKDSYSNYYICKWKKEGLQLITQRPPTTTKSLFEEFLKNRTSRKRYQGKAIRKEKQRKQKLNLEDFIRRDYK